MSHRPIAVWLLIILQLLLGFGAFISGGLLVSSPSGLLMQMPIEMLRHSPFTNFLVPGIILATLLGIYPMMVSYSLWQKPDWRWPNNINPFKQLHWSWAGSLASGTILLIWIVVEILMLQSVAFLHIVYFAWGWLLILLTLIPQVRQHYKR